MNTWNDTQLRLDAQNAKAEREPIMSQIINTLLPLVVVVGVIGLVVYVIMLAH